MPNLSRNLSNEFNRSFLFLRSNGFFKGFLYSAVQDQFLKVIRLRGQSFRVYRFFKSWSTISPKILCISRLSADNILILFPRSWIRLVLLRRLRRQERTDQIRSRTNISVSCEIWQKKKKQRKKETFKVGDPVNLFLGHFDFIGNSMARYALKWIWMKLERIVCSSNSLERIQISSDSFLWKCET